MSRRLPRQSLLVLSVIHDYRLKHGDAPTLRELAALSGIKSLSHCSRLLDILRQRGLIRVHYVYVQDRRRARFNSARLTSRGLELLGETARVEAGS